MTGVPLLPGTVSTAELTSFTLMLKLVVLVVLVVMWRGREEGKRCAWSCRGSWTVSTRWCSHRGSSGRGRMEGRKSRYISVFCG